MNLKAMPKIEAIRCEGLNYPRNVQTNGKYHGWQVRGYYAMNPVQQRGLKFRFLESEWWDIESQLL